MYAGTITVYGSLVTPKNYASAPDNTVSGAVLVTGSGPNDRWASVDKRLQLFFDTSVALATKGVAVLVFDKRTCSAGTHPVCIPNVSIQWHIHSSTLLKPQSVIVGLSQSLTCVML